MKWFTTDDINYIFTECQKGTSVSVIAKALCYPEKAVSDKIYRLGLRHRDDLWTEEEDMIVSEDYLNRVRAKQTALKIGRSTHAIYRRINILLKWKRLQLRKRKTE